MLQKHVESLQAASVADMLHFNAHWVPLTSHIWLAAHAVRLVCSHFTTHWSVFELYAHCELLAQSVESTYSEHTFWHVPSFHWQLEDVVQAC